jgi:hypothetical protein
MSSTRLATGLADACKWRAPQPETGHHPDMERWWRAAEVDPRRALGEGLSPTDLQSLLLSVALKRASRVTPAGVMRRWREDRFVRPSTHDPRCLSRVEARLWDLLPPTFDGVDLSPVAPLGTCSAVATVDQNRIVSTIRNSEVVSDPTNALAVEAAVRRTDAARVDLAACHRVLRAQVFSGRGHSAHFRLFALVSTTRDQGSGRAEAAMLVDHLRFWARVLGEFVEQPWISLTAFGPSAAAERLDDTVRPALAGIELRDDPTRTHGAGYYAGIAIGLRALDGAAEVDLGDGGTTDWTARLRSDAKERCVISCIATERLAVLAHQPNDR